MMIQFLIILITLLCGISFADTAVPQDSASTESSTEHTRYLHISTNPTKADIFVNRSSIDFSSMPDYVSPNFVEIPQGDSTVKITLFQLGYNDTTINVSLPEKDTSFLIVSLRQSYDEDLTDSQHKIVAHRNRKSLGRKLIWASFVPLATSAVAAIVTQKYIRDARDDRHSIQNSAIRNGDNYQEKFDNFKDNKNKAKTAKTIGGTSLGLGIIVFSAGLILSF